MVKFRKMTELNDLGFDKFRSPTVMVSEDTHKKIQDISDKTGLQMKQVAEILLRYALENVEWEE